MLITDAKGCKDSSSLNVTEFPGITSVSVSGSATLCTGSSTTLSSSVTGGTTPYTYNWAPTGSNTSVSITSAASNILTVTDANGCSQIGFKFLSLLSVPNTDKFPTGCFQNCYKDTLFSGITGATSYQWQLNNVDIPAPAGTGPDLIITNDGSYRVIATSAAGCSDTAGQPLEV